MSSKTRASLLSLTIIAVLVFSAFGTTTAYADGDPPPDPPPIETTTNPDEASAEATSTPEEASPEEASPPTEATTEATSTPEEASPEETSPPTEATAEATVEVSSDSAEVTPEATSTPDGAAGEATSEETSVEEGTAPQPAEEAAPVVEEVTPAPDASILNEVPDNMTVTVLDANGEAQPLATQAAAEAVAASDPIWCSETVVNPTPGTPGCTDSFSSFSALLTELQNNPTLYQGAGTIYVEQGAYQGGESSIDFNAYTLTNISSAALTVNGGWNPTTGAVDSATPSTFSNTRILIGSSTNPWGGSLTINNISIDYSNPGPNIPAVPENGLTLYSQGDITLSNVSVTDAPSAGAELNAGGNVIVNDSTFDRNQTEGATIRSGGDVSIANSSFSNPPTGRRQNTGLDIQSTGSVSLVDVLANENREVGTNIDAGGSVSITSGVFSGTKLIQGANFLGYGLQVITPSTIALTSVTANDNFLWGASLEGGGHIAIVNSIFNANTTASPGFIDDTGLFIHGGSTVSLDNVQANDNRLFGAMIDAVGAVSINNGTFLNNRGVITTGGTTTLHGHGLQVTSLGNISLSNVTATNNMLFGAQLNSGGNVTIVFSDFSDTSTGSSANAVGEGLEVISAGNVSLVDVLLDNNQTVGADIKAGGDVDLIDVIATNNGSDGVLVQGICASVIGGEFSGNGQYGLNLVGSSAIDLVAPPIFGNNGAGDVFPATPANCAVVLSSGNTTTAASPAPTTGAVSSNVFVSLQIAPEQSANTITIDSQSGNSVSEASPGAGTDANSDQQSANTIDSQNGNSVFEASPSANTNTSSENVTLKSLLLRTTTGGIQLSIFTGKYVYIYSSSGIQIVAFSPSSNGIAMAGPYKAY